MLSRCIMASSLPQEFNKFCKLTEQLRQILRQTQKCFHDINTLGNFEGVQVISAELSKEEEKEIDNLTKKTPCLVILGQSNYSKAFVVNEIFNRTLLPPINYGEEAVRWRMVSFRYGDRTSVSLELPGSFELVEELECFNKSWSTIPQTDLELSSTEDDSAKASAVLDVRLNHPLLKHGGQVVVSPCNWGTVHQVYQKCTEDVIPVTIYAISESILSEKDLSDLRELKEQFADIAVFFVKVPVPSELDHNSHSSDFSDSGLMLSPEAAPITHTVNVPDLHVFGRNIHLSESELNGEILYRKNLSNDSSRAGDDKRNRRSRSTWYVTNSAGGVISSGLQNTSVSHSLDHKPSHESPKKRNAMLVQSSSFNIFQQLLDLGYLKLVPPASRQLGSDICRIDSELVEKFENFPTILSFTRIVLQNYLVQTTSLLNVVHTRCLQTFITTAFEMARDMMITPRRLDFAKSKESELYASLMDIALKKQDEIRKIIAETIEDMQDTLLDKAENYEFIGVDIPETGEVTSSKDLKICTGQIQELVLGGLNQAIAGKLIGSVDILKDSYTGVLTRCLESLEQSDRENPDSTRTTLALREILNSAYQVEITVRAGSSFIRILLEKMKQLIHSMPWKTPPTVGSEWKRKVAADMLSSLSDYRLSKSICQQIKERLKHSHDTFSLALKQLETRHTGRLEKTEEQRIKVRKIHAPKVARLALESTSLKDYILYGMPDMGREVGRGQYGVVYSCGSWGGYAPCAIKSVVPPDDKHWNDLALEFYYTKNVPEHDRIVSLRGSVIDYTYGGGSSPAVLLVMDRLQKDLYTAIKTGMEWIGRLQVAIDVVEGIRFLHNQGLIHRDIKLKNVLLDETSRGKITDLGFCKPEAMMSGSIVGTPIHMAPELFSGRYDYSVDVYAFGILFWYVCAGHVRLPYNFEQCTSKDMLWTSVRRGIRPERLPQFDAKCWDLMQSCWNGEASCRPLLGNLEPQLRTILESYKNEQSPITLKPSRKFPQNGNV